MTLNTNQINGVIVVDKPQGMTSHDVVDRVRRLTPPKTKVGHTGTLDPMATGVLLIALGNAPRLIQYTHNLPKTYNGTITLGATSDTDDAEGTISSTNSRQPSAAEIQTIAQKFVGESIQQPPAYSAIKYKGKKLYEYARRGQAQEIIKKVGERRAPITIYSIEIISYAYAEIEIKVVCSSGTYIRSLARDIGETLKTSGYLSALRRTAIGQFSVEQALDLEKLSTGLHQGCLQTTSTLVQHLPSITLAPDNVAQYMQGRSVKINKEELRNFSLPTAPIATFDSDGNVLGVSIYALATSLLSPKTILV